MLRRIKLLLSHQRDINSVLPFLCMNYEMDNCCCMKWTNGIWTLMCKVNICDVSRERNLVGGTIAI